jgi:hypothetical protein
MLNRSLFRCVAVSAIAALGLTTDAFAQSRSLFGTSSIMSSSQGGARSTSTGSFGSSMSGTGGFGSTQGGMGSTSSVGTSALGSTANLGFNQQGMVGTAGRSSTGTGGRFIGGNTTGGQLGQNQLGLGGQNRLGQNQLGLGATGQAGRGNTTRGRNNPNQPNQQNMQGLNQAGRGRAGGNTTSTLRPQQRVAFEYTVPSAPETQAVLKGRFESVRTGPKISGVDVSYADGIVTLRGTVDSEDSRKLATLLARLEPGVRTVNDELVVQPAATESR